MPDRTITNRRHLCVGLSQALLLTAGISLVVLGTRPIVQNGRIGQLDVMRCNFTVPPDQWIEDGDYIKVPVKCSLCFGNATCPKNTSLTAQFPPPLLGLATVSPALRSAWQLKTMNKTDVHTYVSGAVGYTELLDMMTWFLSAISGGILVLCAIVWAVQTLVKLSTNIANRPGFDKTAGRAMPASAYERVAPELPNTDVPEHADFAEDDWMGDVEVTMREPRVEH